MLDRAIAALDVVEAEGVPEGGERDQPREIGGESRIIGDAPEVALELADIGRVEAGLGGGEAGAIDAMQLSTTLSTSNAISLQLKRIACFVLRR